jgi:hypothetical protein
MQNCFSLCSSPCKFICQIIQSCVYLYVTKFYQVHLIYNSQRSAKFNIIITALPNISYWASKPTNNVHWNEYKRRVIVSSSVQTQVFKFNAIRGEWFARCIRSLIWRESRNRDVTRWPKILSKACRQRHLILHGRSQPDCPPPSLRLSIGPIDYPGGMRNGDSCISFKRQKANNAVVCSRESRWSRGFAVSAHYFRQDLLSTCKRVKPQKWKGCVCSKILVLLVAIVWNDLPKRAKWNCEFWIVQLSFRFGKKW